MEAVIIFNGLGNQMSQYAFFLAKKKYVKNCLILFDTCSQKRHNGLELDKVFHIKYESGFKMELLSFILFLLGHKLSRAVLWLLGIRLINEHRNYDYDEKYLRHGRGWLNFYRGGWHSEKYFKDLREEILKVFQIKTTIKDVVFNNIARKVQSSNAVSLHIRRGDYLNVESGNFYQYGGVATKEYYHKAIEYYKNLIGNPLFFVFSNDLPWCKQQFGEKGFVYVDCNQGTNSWRDLYLMSMCKYHINANSTFSWWGAWLCQRDGQSTICPERFLANIKTKDFYPESWIKISTK